MRVARAGARARARARLSAARALLLPPPLLPAATAPLLRSLAPRQTELTTIVSKPAAALSLRVSAHLLLG